MALSPDIYRMLVNYIEMCHRIVNFPKDDRRGVFVCYPKDDGTVNEMSASNVNKAIQRIWRKGPITKPISATMIRKATSSHVRDAAPDMRLKLARHMCHSARTADMYYDLHNAVDSAEPIAKLISSVMENSQKSTHKSIHWPKEHSTETEQPNPMQLCIEEDTPMEECIEKDTPMQDCIEEDSNTNFMQVRIDDIPNPNPNSQTSTTKHGRRTFEDDEAKTLIAICEPLLRKGSIILSEVMCMVTAHPKGKLIYLALKDRLVSTERTPSKVLVDRLRTELRKRQKSQAMNTQL